MADTSISTKDGITTIMADDGRISVNLDFQRFFSMTDDRNPAKPEGPNEALKKQKRLIRFLVDWNVPYDEIDDLFDEAVEALPESERIVDCQREWLKATKREKPADKMAERLAKMEYRISHEDAIVASDADRAIVFEYYPKSMPEFDGNDDGRRLERLHDRILDAEWKTIGTITKDELNLEIASSDMRFMRLFDSRMNRATVKKCARYIKDMAIVQTEGTNLVAFQISDDLTLYVGRIAE